MLSRARDRVGWPVVVVLALLALAPLVFTGASAQSVLVEAMIYAVGAIGLDVLTGYSGQYSFGQFVYFAVGAYLMSVLVTHAGLPWYAALLIAVVVTGALAGIMAAALVRLNFFGSAVGTFFMGAAAVDVLNGNRLAQWTGGASGISTPTAALGSIDLTTGMGLYYFVLIALVIAAAVSVRYIRTRVGTAARVVKQNQTVAAAMGIRVAREKIRAHVLAGALAGLGGCLLAIDIGFLSPDTFSVEQSIELFAIVLVGGLGSIAGPIIGAVFFFEITNSLSSSSSAASMSGMIFALLLLVVVVLFHGGLYDLGERLVRQVRRVAGTRGRRPAPSRADKRREAALEKLHDVKLGGVTSGKLEVPGPLLQVKDVAVRFGGVNALSGVLLEVQPGEIHAIIGPNGAGKTTLLNTISGIQPPAEGTITLGGRSLRGLSVSSTRQAGIARTFQHPSLVSDLNVLDNVTIGAFETQDGSVWTELAATSLKRRRRRVAQARALAALESLEFPKGRWTAPAGDLTMGEQKHVDIARAISARPTLLLLDEPTAGLGVEEMAAVARAVKSVQESGVTILVIAHHVGFVRQVADRCTVLDFGRVIATGTPDEALRDERVAEVFLGGQRERESEDALVGFGAIGVSDTSGVPARLEASDRPRTLARAGDAGGAGLAVDGLHVRVSGARIIEGLSLTVGKGEIVGLAGRNGAGKTTTLRAISAMESRSRGTVTLDGTQLPATPEAVARMGVAHVPEGRGIFPDLSVEENIRLGLVGRAAPDPALQQRLDEAFPVVAKLKRQKAGRLSGGEQQMIALYRGLISSPRILLVDEMSLGLSPRALTTAIEMLATIGRTEGIGVLVVDQNVRALSDYCDRMYLLKDGSVAPMQETADLDSAYFEG